MTGEIAKADAYGGILVNAKSEVLLRELIDTNQRVPVPPGIFVIWDGMGLVAKRIEHIPHWEPPKIVIKSVNPEYQTYERDAEEVHIIGRVIWAAKRL